MSGDPTLLSAAELSRAIHQRRLTCTAVMEAYLGRIEALNPQINAIVSLRPRSELMEEAHAADHELEDGRSRGWLHGLPTAIKDLAEAKGLPCTWGSRIFADFVPDADAIHVERIRAAGAIVIGKTNTPEFGLGSHTTNPLFGPTRNPHDRSRSAGGSSGGAAAALAARLLPIADGSDMMGSLRNPAAFNDVVGFRPSVGRVPSRRPAELFFTPLGTNGPMARTVEDVALLLQTMAGYDARDPLSLADEDVRPAGPGRTEGMKIAWLGDYGGYLPFEPDVLELDRRALETMATMGCEIHEPAPGFDMTELWSAWLALRSFYVAHGLRPLYDDPGKRALFNRQLVFEFDRALGTSAAEVFAASQVRTKWYRHVCELFARYDFLVMPAAQVFPFDVELDWPKEIAGQRMDTYHRWMEVVIGPSMAGLPVAALPAGFNAQGLPNGVQVAGPPRGDRALLAFALAYEQAAARRA